MKIIIQKTIARVASLLLGVMATASVSAAEATYIDANGDEQTADNAVVVTSSTTTFTDGGWYVVNGTVSTGMITVNGTANLILADGATLTATGTAKYDPGVKVTSGNTLIIYGQSSGTSAGALVASGNESKCAGIGGGSVNNNGQACGTVKIYGGNITANGTKGAGAIGGGAGGSSSGTAGAGGTVEIYGGTVTAIASGETNGTNTYGPAIGGGTANRARANDGTLTVAKGMTVVAGTDAASATALTPAAETGAVELGGERYFKITAPTALTQTVSDLGEVEQGAVTNWNLVATLEGNVTPYVFSGDVDAGFSFTEAGVLTLGEAASGIYNITLTAAGSGASRLSKPIEFTWKVTVLEHDPIETKPAKEPTYYEDGWTHEVVCSRCGAILEASVTIPKLVPHIDFVVPEVQTDEASAVEIRISRASVEVQSGVKLYLSYNTATAADLDLAKGAIDGVTPKGGLKFPLQLSWEADDIVERVVTIPVKADKAVEDDEFFTLQLAAPVGMELGDATICTVTIHDPGYDELRDRINAGTATKAESNTWTKVSHEGIHYIRGLAEPADAGKVTGSGLCAEGKKVTLKATANKGFVFMDWCDAAGSRVATNATLVVDRTAKPAASSATSTTLTDVDDDAMYYAKFITVDEDVASITLALGSEVLDGSTVLETNVTCGVALEWLLKANALSATTVKVAGLPAGLKFDAKSNTIYGAPTAASKVDAKKGVVPSDVKITVTTAGKSSVTYLVKLTVDPLPAWAVGTFDGEVEGGGIVQAFTVATSGKISGKVLEGGRTWTLSAGQFNHVEHVEQVGGSDVFYAAVVGKAGKEVVTNSVVVAAEDGMGVAEADVPRNWIARQNLWKRADTNAAQPVFKKSIVVEYGDPDDTDNMVKFTFKNGGAVSFSGKIDGVGVSGSSQLTRNGDAWKVTLYAPPKGAFKGFSETFAVTLTFDEANAVTGVDVAEWQ